MLLDTPLCNFGWDAPHFELPDAHGTHHTFEDHMGEKGLLIAFICNHCPYVKAIIDRLVADANTLKAEGINTVGIMSNDYAKYPADSPENMIRFAAQHNIAFPYLIDETQATAKAYDAVCTPDFFGLNPDGKLQYRGRLDNLRMEEDTGGRTPELLNAMRMVAETGNGPQDQTASMGCSIKWKA